MAKTENINIYKPNSTMEARNKQAAEQSAKKFTDLLRNQDKGKKVPQNNISQQRIFNNEDQKLRSLESAYEVKVQPNSGAPAGVYAEGGTTVGGFDQASNNTFESKQKKDSSRFFHLNLVSHLSKQHNEMKDMFGQQAKVLNSISNFQTTIQANFYKSTLEFQGKVLTELGAIRSALMVGFNINPNTGEKDYEKEAEDQKLLDKLLFKEGKSGFKEGLGQAWGRAKSAGLKYLAKRTIGSMGDELSMAMDMLGGMDPGTLISFGISVGRGEALKFGKNWFKDTDMGQTKTSRNLLRFLFDPAESINDHIVAKSQSNSLYKLLGNILGIDTSTNSINKIETLSEKQYKDVRRSHAAFDGVAHTALTKVIPTLLSKQLAVLSGTEAMYYNYDQNKFLSGKTISKINKASYSEDLTKGIQRSFSQSLGNTDNGKTTGSLLHNILETLNTYDYSKLVEDVKKQIKEIIKNEPRLKNMNLLFTSILIELKLLDKTSFESNKNIDTELRENMDSFLGRIIDILGTSNDGGFGTVRKLLNRALERVPSFVVNETQKNNLAMFIADVFRALLSDSASWDMNYISTFGFVDNNISTDMIDENNGMKNNLMGSAFVDSENNTLWDQALSANKLSYGSGITFSNIKNYKQFQKIKNKMAPTNAIEASKSIPVEEIEKQSNQDSYSYTGVNLESFLLSYIQDQGDLGVKLKVTIGSKGTAIWKVKYTANKELELTPTVGRVDKEKRLHIKNTGNEGLASIYKVIKALLTGYTPSNKEYKDYVFIYDDPEFFKEYTKWGESYFTSSSFAYENETKNSEYYSGDSGSSDFLSKLNENEVIYQKYKAYIASKFGKVIESQIGFADREDISDENILSEKYREIKDKYLRSGFAGVDADEADALLEGISSKRDGYGKYSFKEFQKKYTDDKDNKFKDNIDRLYSSTDYGTNAWEKGNFAAQAIESFRNSTSVAEGIYNFMNITGRKNVNRRMINVAMGLATNLSGKAVGDSWFAYGAKSAINTMLFKRSTELANFLDAFDEDAMKKRSDKENKEKQTEAMADITSLGINQSFGSAAGTMVGRWMKNNLRFGGPLGLLSNLVVTAAIGKLKPLKFVKKISKFLFGETFKGFSEKVKVKFNNNTMEGKDDTSEETKEDVKKEKSSEEATNATGDVEETGKAASVDDIYRNCSKLLSKLKGLGTKDFVCGPYALGALAVNAAGFSIDNYVKTIKHWISKGYINEETGLSSTFLTGLGFSVVYTNRGAAMVEKDLLNGNFKKLSYYDNNVFLVNGTRGGIKHWFAIQIIDGQGYIYDNKNRSSSSKRLDKSVSISTIYRISINGLSKILNSIISGNYQDVMKDNINLAQKARKKISVQAGNETDTNVSINSSANKFTVSNSGGGVLAGISAMTNEKLQSLIQRNTPQHYTQATSPLNYTIAVPGGKKLLKELAFSGDPVASQAYNLLSRTTADDEPNKPSISDQENLLKDKLDKDNSRVDIDGKGGKSDSKAHGIMGWVQNLFKNTKLAGILSGLGGFIAGAGKSLLPSLVTAGLMIAGYKAVGEGLLYKLGNTLGTPANTLSHSNNRNIALILKNRFMNVVTHGIAGAESSLAKNAAKTTAEKATQAGAEAAAKGAGEEIIKRGVFSKVFSALTQNIMKWTGNKFPGLLEALAKAKIGEKIFNFLVKLGKSQAKKSGGGILTKILNIGKASISTVGGAATAGAISIAMVVGFASWGFYSGFKNASKILEIPEDKIIATDRIACGITRALADAIPCIPALGLVASILVSFGTAIFEAPLAKILADALRAFKYVVLGQKEAKMSIREQQKKYADDNDVHKYTIDENGNMLKDNEAVVGVKSEQTENAVYMRYDDYKKMEDGKNKTFGGNGYKIANMIGGKGSHVIPMIKGLGGKGMEGIGSSSISNTLAGGQMPTFISQKTFDHIKIGQTNAVFNGCALACGKMITEFYEKDITDQELVDTANKYLLDDQSVSTDYFAALKGYKTAVSSWLDRLHKPGGIMMVLLIDAGDSNHFITVYKSPSENYYVGDPMSDNWEFVDEGYLRTLSVKHARWFDKSKGLVTNPSTDFLGGSGLLSNIWNKAKGVAAKVFGKKNTTNAPKNSAAPSSQYYNNSTTQANSINSMANVAKYGASGIITNFRTLSGMDIFGNNNTDSTVSGGGRWVDIARQEMAKGLSYPKEEGSIDSNSPAGQQLAIYAGVTKTLNPNAAPDTSFKNNWCGAFATYCLVKGGVTFVNNYQGFSSQAPVNDTANFKKLGEPALGALIVWGSGSSGHVAIVSSVNGDTITYIGGNQGIGDKGMRGVSEKNTIKGAPLDKMPLVGYYWPNSVPEGALGLGMSTDISTKAGIINNILNVQEGGMKIHHDGSRDSIRGVVYRQNGKVYNKRDALASAVDKWEKEGKGLSGAAYDQIISETSRIAEQEYWSKHNLDRVFSQNPALAFVMMNLAYQSPSGYKKAGFNKYENMDVSNKSLVQEAVDNYAKWMQTAQNFNKNKAGLMNRVNNVAKAVGATMPFKTGRGNMFDSNFAAKQAKDLLNILKNSAVRNILCGPYALGALALNVGTSTVQSIADLMIKWVTNGTIDGTSGLSSALLATLGFIENPNRITDTNINRIVTDPNMVYMINCTHSGVKHWLGAHKINNKILIYDSNNNSGVTYSIAKDTIISSIYITNAEVLSNNIMAMLNGSNIAKDNSFFTKEDLANMPMTSKLIDAYNEGGVTGAIKTLFNMNTSTNRDKANSLQGVNIPKQRGADPVVSNLTNIGNILSDLFNSNKEANSNNLSALAKLNQTSENIFGANTTNNKLLGDIAKNTKNANANTNLITQKFTGDTGVKSEYKKLAEIASTWAKSPNM